MSEILPAAQDVETAIRGGRLREALAGLESSVRKSPGRLELRIRLLQVLLLLGEWDRARTQVEVLPGLGSADADRKSVV